MKLNEFKRSGSKMAAYTAVVADQAGQRDYELTISGRRSLVERVFKKVDFDVIIDTHVSPEEFDARSREVWTSRVAGQEIASPSAEEVLKAASRKVPPPHPRNSVVVSLRRIRGTGTFWTAWVTPIYVPPGSSLYFVMPRVWTCWGIIVPYSGNPNLLLSLGTPVSPPVSTAFAPGPVSETVAFTGSPLPWMHFAAWFRIFGAAPGTITLFGMVGHSIP